MQKFYGYLLIFKFILMNPQLPRFFLPQNSQNTHLRTIGTKKHSFRLFILHFSYNNPHPKKNHSKPSTQNQEAVIIHQNSLILSTWVAFESHQSHEFWVIVVCSLVRSTIMIQQISVFPKMCERKIWKEQDDHILKELFEVRKIRKWSEISRIMQEQYNITARNGKQCRERYHNHLRRGINKDKWTKQEELHLIDLHAHYGNRWALISKQIEGRTQNCVKNMLYSKLRKAIRQLNRFLFIYYRKEIKEIKLNFIYRLIEFTENAYKRDAAERNDMEMLAITLKNQILRVQLQEGRETTQAERITVKQLIQEIHTFKRKNQRFRGNLSGAGKAKPKPNKDQTLANSAVMERETKVEQIETENRYTEEQKQRQSTFGCLPTFNNDFSMKTTLSTLLLSAQQMQERKISKLGIQKMDSLQSNFSFHLADAGLQMPIQVDAQYGYVDPSGIFEEWGDLGNAWVPNFYY